MAFIYFWDFTTSLVILEVDNFNIFWNFRKFFFQKNKKIKKFYFLVFVFFMISWSTECLSMIKLMFYRYFFSTQNILNQYAFLCDLEWSCKLQFWWPKTWFFDEKKTSKSGNFFSYCFHNFKVSALTKWHRCDSNAVATIFFGLLVASVDAFEVEQFFCFCLFFLMKNPQYSAL